MSAATAKGPQISSAFRLLLWLKWTLMWRGIGRDKMRLFGTIIIVVVFTPISGGLAFLCWIMSVHHPVLLPYIGLAALGLAYLIWLITPLLGFPLNESYDPTRLFAYPVSYRTIFLASAVAGCFDLPTLFVLPIFLALILAASTTPLVGVACVLLIALFLLQTIATAQAVMLALIGFLRSRRFRDITMVLLPLFGMAFYIAQQTAIRRMDLFVTGFRDMLQSPVWRVMRYFPPGWAVSGMMAARAGDYLHALFFLVLLGLVCAMMAYAAAHAMRSLYLGERGPLVAPSPRTPSTASVFSRTPNPPSPFPTGAGGANSPGSFPEPRASAIAPAAPVASRAERASDTSRAERASEFAGGIPRSGGLSEAGQGVAAKPFLLPPALAAVIQKEWRYLWRDPQYKVAAINMLYTLVIFALAFILNPSWRYLTAMPGSGFGGALGGPLAAFLRGLISFRIVGILLLASLPLVFNIFGGEGTSITILFSFPTPRRYLFIGKNLAHAAIVLALCVVGVLGGSYLTNTLSYAGIGLLEALVAIPILLAAGNLISIRFPHRMVVRGQRWNRSNQVALGGAGGGTGTGCGYAFVYLACFFATFVAVMPAVIGVAWPFVIDAGALWCAFGIGVSFLYSLLLYGAGLYMASTWILTREMAIIERLSPAE